MLAYDLTFSAPKSVSVLWAAGDGHVRREVLAAVDAATEAGVGWMERHGAKVRVRGEAVDAEGLVGTSWLHSTSRAMDPQLHRHVVVANMAAVAGGDDKVRALDGRALFAEAKTAGYVAAAELRHQLSTRLGVTWRPVVNGVADIARIEQEALAEVSQRSADIAAMVTDTGMSSAAARQAAAYATRTAKDTAVDAALLGPWWQERLKRTGFGPAQLAAVVDHGGPRLVTDADRVGLDRQLAGGLGLTEQVATFGRGDVVCAIAEWSVDRCTADQLEDLADLWLAGDDAIALAPVGAPQRAEDGHVGVDTRSGDVIRRRDGRVVRSGTAERWTTASMVAAERTVYDVNRRGRDAGAGTVDSALVEAELAARPTIGDDQAAMVRAVTSSGHRVQCILGPAGSGKTFALDAAARAWEAAGYRVLGAAVAGTAAEVLGRGAGIEARTVASLLTQLDGDPDAIGPRTVVVVDEASTIGTRDLARLASHVDRTGATLRLVGDPAQHSAVAAGGAFRHLTEVHADTPRLTELRRQLGPAMAGVRLALTDYREGRIAEAWDRLDDEGRVVEADTAEELLDLVAADWYVDRQCRVEDPTRKPSSMVAEAHTERRMLNARARALLEADGTLAGAELLVAGQAFRAGDEVIARAQNRQLHPEGDRTAYVRNGTRGAVVAVVEEAEGSGLLVDFAGRGQVLVPVSFLERQVRPGIVGGLTHAYALTSFAAHGETYASARHVATDTSSRAAVYVGLSRGQSDARAYAVRRRDLVAGDAAVLEPDDDPALPRVPRPQPEAVTAGDAVAAKLAAGGPELLATEVDPDAARVVELARTVPLPQLALHAGEDPLAARAAAELELRAARRAVAAPPSAVVGRLGPRPDGGDDRRQWDRAVGAAGIAAAHCDPAGPDPGPSHWALGSPAECARGRSPVGPGGRPRRQSRGRLRGPQPRRACAARGARARSVTRLCRPTLDVGAARSYDGRRSSRPLRSRRRDRRCSGRRCSC